MRWIIVLLIIVSMFFLVGCEQAVQEIVNLPDVNPDDAIVEEDVVDEPEPVVEEPVVPACEDECEGSGCDGDDYFDCVEKEDGCKDKVVEGMVKGECGIDCFFDSSCDSKERCDGHKCVEVPSELSYDLADFPEPFVVNGKYSNYAKVVLGDTAPASDTLAAIEITSRLQKESSGQISVNPQLASEIVGKESSYDLILIGTSCDNSAVEKVLGISCAGWEFEGSGVIKVVENGDRIALLISGDTPENTRDAAKVLANYDSYGLSGEEYFL